MLEQAHYSHQRTNLTAVKRVAAWIGLALVALLVWSWYGQYRAGQAAWDAAQSKPKPSELASATAAPAGPSKAPKAPTGIGQISKVAIVSDVTLRKDPSTTSEAIRDLKTGEQLTLVGQVGAWLKVSDASGAIGWVSASAKYTKVLGK